MRSLSENRYTEWLIEEIKLLAIEIHDHADEIVGSMAGTTDFNIQIHVPSRPADELPTIEVTQSYLPNPNEFMSIYNKWHKKTYEKVFGRGAKEVIKDGESSEAG